MYLELTTPGSSDAPRASAAEPAAPEHTHAPSPPTAVAPISVQASSELDDHSENKESVSDLDVVVAAGQAEPAEPAPETTI